MILRPIVETVLSFLIQVWIFSAVINSSNSATDSLTSSNLVGSSDISKTFNETARPQTTAMMMSAGSTETSYYTGIAPFASVSSSDNNVVTASTVADMKTVDVLSSALVVVNDITFSESYHATTTVATTEATFASVNDTTAVEAIHTTPPVKMHSTMTDSTIQSTSARVYATTAAEVVQSTSVVRDHAKTTDATIQTTSANLLVKTTDLLSSMATQTIGNTERTGTQMSQVHSTTQAQTSGTVTIEMSTKINTLNTQTTDSMSISPTTATMFPSSTAETTEGTTTVATSLMCYSCNGNDSACGIKRKTADPTVTCSPGEKYCHFNRTEQNSMFWYVRRCVSFCTAIYGFRCAKSVCERCCTTSLCNDMEYPAQSTSQSLRFSLFIVLLVSAIQFFCDA